VLAKIDEEGGFDLLVDLGDVMWGWPAEQECLALLRSRCDVMVRGNSDREAGLEGPHRVAVDDVLFVHATPRDDEECVTRLTPPDRLARIVEGVDARLVVGGHVHHQFELSSGAVRWVNAGSVGLPYEDRPGAFWLAIVDGEPHFRRTEYDLSLLPADSPHAAAVRGEITADEAARQFEPRE
jgi:predicted phosphodiesterase